MESYQGIPMLIESMLHIKEPAHLLLIGGNPDQHKKIQALIHHKGLQKRITILGKKNAEEIPYYLNISDALVSPRISGTNIPLKIYSYLKSGIPVVATNLYTHTQTLDKDIAILTDPEPEKFAEGIHMAFAEEGKKIAQNALHFCKKNYTYDRYLNLVNTSLEKTRR
jgi:glycosyltransferase involved in cell wall biosynthesis